MKNKKPPQKNGVVFNIIVHLKTYYQIIKMASP